MAYPTFFGRTAYPLPADLKVSTDLVGAYLLINHAAHTLRLVNFIHHNLTMSSPGLDQALSVLRTMPGGVALADHYQASFIHYTAVSYAYQNEKGYMMLEGTVFDGNDTLLPNSVQAHLSAGYHLGKFTPFFTLAGKHVSNVTTHPNPIVNALLAERATGQKSVVVGGSWRFDRDTLVKAQYDYVMNDLGSVGALGNIQPGFQPGGRYHLISAAVERRF